MRALKIPVAVLAVAAMVGATALLMGWPLERAVYLAPVIVVGFAALIGLTLLTVGISFLDLGAGHTVAGLAIAVVKALLSHGANPNATIAKATPIRRLGEDLALPTPLLGATPFFLARAARKRGNANSRQGNEMLRGRAGKG